eukprot:365142-Chlamydomonas_euryale.AAC.1
MLREWVQIRTTAASRPSTPRLVDSFRRSTAAAQRSRRRCGRGGPRLSRGVRQRWELCGGGGQPPKMHRMNVGSPQTCVPGLHTSSVARRRGATSCRATEQLLARCRDQATGEHRLTVLSSECMPPTTAEICNRGIASKQLDHLSPDPTDGSCASTYPYPGRRRLARLRRLYARLAFKSLGDGPGRCKAALESAIQTCQTYEGAEPQGFRATIQARTWTAASKSPARPAAAAAAAGTSTETASRSSVSGERTRNNRCAGMRHGRASRAWAGARPRP